MGFAGDESISTLPRHQNTASKFAAVLEKMVSGAHDRS